MKIVDSAMSADKEAIPWILKLLSFLRLQGHSSTKSYVAAQGPMQETIADFWRMVWEHDVHSIVMMTKLEENGEVRIITAPQIAIKNKKRKNMFSKYCQ